MSWTNFVRFVILSRSLRGFTFIAQVRRLFFLDSFEVHMTLGYFFILFWGAVYMDFDMTLMHFFLSLTLLYPFLG